ncbi:MAG TPA: SRPBCC family protein [Chloroflexia bacterium]|jgi:ribosome-associated toxin RatA of RatAB toxin-antitoxin module
MDTSNQVVMRAEYSPIFELASRVEDWGQILPHYRYVKVLRRDGNRKWVRMSAWRDFVPVTWTAIETVVEGTAEEPGRIFFRHIRGLVRGMDVEWSFQVRPDRGDVLVTISHHLEKPPFPVRILGSKLIKIVVGKGFIGYIAGKTLRRIKVLVET